MARTKGAKNKPKDLDADKPASASKRIKKSEEEKQRDKELKQHEKELKKQAKELERINKEYEYTPLADTALGSTEQYNIFAVVIDAQLPYDIKKDNQTKFCCRIKVVDQSLHCRNNTSNNTAAQDISSGCVMVTFWSKDSKKLPVIKTVGDIIRIHRAFTSCYRDYKTLNCNLDLGSNWTLFSAADNTIPEDYKQIERKIQQINDSSNIKKFMMNTEESKDPESSNQLSKEALAQLI